MLVCISVLSYSPSQVVNTKMHVYKVKLTTSLHSCQIKYTRGLQWLLRSHTFLGTIEEDEVVYNRWAGAVESIVNGE